MSSSTSTSTACTPRPCSTSAASASFGDQSRDDGTVRLGAGVSYHDIIEGLRAQLPGLTMAARTVGSPQIRNRGTVGGNLGSASPAGDAHPPLLASGADIEVESVGPQADPDR